MAGSPNVPYLRHLSPPHSPGHPESLYPLLGGEIVIGRDPRCQIVLDSLTYGGVSRQHIKLIPSPEATTGWQVCDLNSANGTYINGQRLQGCRDLQWGDRLVLGNQNAPEFVLEAPSVSSTAAAAVSGASPGTARPDPLTASSPSAAGDVTMSQLFPILSTGRDLRKKAYLIPGGLTVAFVILMFLSIGNSGFFNFVLAAYMAGAAYFFVFQLCGKRKPWWVLISSGLMTVFLLLSPVLDLLIFIFRGILPGDIPEGETAGNFLTVLVQMFFGAGLMEELLKAIPIFFFLFLGQQLRSPRREAIGVWEPLDGILLGTASAVGFTLLETLGQYVPNIIAETLQAGENSGELLGLQLLIPRILGSIAGHMAYSGYFGYFIGLSMLKPSKRWTILTIGYLTASGLHALWNASGILSFILLASVGILSYAFLAAAILKARAISPTRSDNFATRFIP